MEIFILIPILLFIYAIVLIIVAPFAFLKTNLCDDLLNFAKVSKRGFFVIENWREKNDLETDDIYRFFNPFFRPWNALFVRRYALIPNDEIGREFIQYMKGESARLKQKKDRQKEIVKNSSWQKEI